MGTSQTEFRSQTVDLSAEAFDTFCNDISGMFGVDMTCKQQEVAAETFQGIKKRFKGMVAVNCIKAEGALDGTFQLVFDRDGLFILAGIVLTLPEQKILENIKSGSPEEKEADGLRDALTEAGNLLAGSWDRVFRKGLEGHGHLAQTDVFIGDPWLKPEENVGLAGDEKLEFVAYEMTVGPYPAFNCGVIFPKTIFGDLLEAEAEAEEKSGAEAEEKTESEAEEEVTVEAEEKAKPEAEEEVTVEAEEKAEAETEEKVEAEVEEKAEVEAAEEPKAEAEEKTETETEEETDEKAQEQEAAVEETDSEESDTTQESDREKSESQESVAEKAPPEETAAKEDTEEASVTKDEAASAEEPEPAEEAKPVEKEPAAEKVGEEETAAKEQADVTVGEKATDADESAADDAEEKEAVPAESKEQPISEAIRKMGESPAVLPGEPAPAAAAQTPPVSSTGVASAMCAKDIMQEEVVWGDPDDSVHQALTKMQQYDAGYMMVGRDGVLEGIVSKSDIAGAISPYLRPVFAKWRRPADDATLQIKVKWIMIRPVHTIRPETSLAAIMENMCQSGRRVLPVMDQQGKIRGLVTVFDVFKALLNGDPNVSTAGKTPEAPPLV